MDLSRDESSDAAGFFDDQYTTVVLYKILFYTVKQAERIKRDKEKTEPVFIEYYPMSLNELWVGVCMICQLTEAVEPSSTHRRHSYRSWQVIKTDIDVRLYDR